jgi:hypothetical protein
MPIYIFLDRDIYHISQQAADNGCTESVPPSGGSGRQHLPSWREAAKLPYCSSLGEFLLNHVRRSLPIRRRNMRPIPPRLTDTCFPPGILCGVLDSAYRIRLLTHACLEHYLDCFNQLRPLKLPSHLFHYPRDNAWKATPPGEPCAQV